MSRAAWPHRAGREDLFWPPASFIFTGGGGGITPGGWEALGHDTAAVPLYTGHKVQNPSERKLLNEEPGHPSILPAFFDMTGRHRPGNIGRPGKNEPADNHLETGDAQMPIYKDAIYKYAEKCVSFAEEIEYVLSGDEYEDVYDEMRKFSSGDWYEWRDNNKKDVEKIAVSTPKQRDKILQSLKREEKLLFVFAATQYCLEAAEFLYAMDEHCHIGGPYRHMMTRVHRARDVIEAREKSYWPWGTERWPGYKDWPIFEEYLKSDEYLKSKK